MDITLIRHTSVNVKKGICYGHSDVGLSKSFNSELKEIKQKIVSVKYDLVFSSPLSRCQKLANNLFPNQNIILDDRLKELNFGNWEGIHWNDIYKSLEAKLFFDDYINTRCPNGESYNDLFIRINTFFQELNLSKNEKIAIVCHGGPIRAFISIIEEITPQQAFEKKVEYGAVLRYNIKS